MKKIGILTRTKVPPFIVTLGTMTIAERSICWNHVVHIRQTYGQRAS